jgi:tetratricopeptide (TPR) repeat protein
LSAPGRIPPLLSLLLASLLLGSGVGHAAVRWLQSNDNREPWQLALELAQRNRQPIMAFVFIQNRQLTDLMDAQTFADAAVSEAANKSFQCVRVDAMRAENRPILQRYRVGRTQVEPVEGAEVRGQALPVTIFIGPSGEAEHMVYGFVIPDDFVVLLQQALEVIQLREKLGTEEKDAAALARLGSLYVELQRYDVGRQALEKALKLDRDNKLGFGAPARLDLALALVSTRDFDGAIALISETIALFPESELKCKAHYMLGAVLLGDADRSETRAEELARQKDEAGAAQARERALLSRRQAEEAWRWFEAPGPNRKGPCDGTEWAGYALGALAELRAELDFAAADSAAKALVGAGKFLEAADAYRAFEAKHPGTNRACEAAYQIGDCLLRAGKRDDALKQWRSLTTVNQDDPKQNPCSRTPWRRQAAQALERNEKAP